MDEEIDELGEDSYEEKGMLGKFVCPNCSREYQHPGTCPEDGEELMPEQEIAEGL